MVDATFTWEDTGAALLRSLECTCGETIVDSDSGERYGLEAHEEMPGYREFECDDCGRVYAPEWVGMDIKHLDGPDKPVTIEYMRHYSRYYEAVESVEAGAGRLSWMRADGDGAPIAIYDSDGEQVWDCEEARIDSWACEQFGHRHWADREYYDDDVRVCTRCHEKRTVDELGSEDNE